MKLWRADLSIPFAFTNDSLFHSTVIKGIIDNGSWYFNAYLGMPTGLFLYDFPSAYSFYFLVIKAMSFFTSNYALVINIFFLFSFPLVTITALFVFRSFKVSYGPAIVGSILFAFLPYHFLRGQQHLYLSSYFMIPLVVLVALWIALDKPFIFTKKNNKIKFDFSFMTIASIAIIIITASTGIYYVFFAGFFFLVSGLIAYSKAKDFRPVFVSVFLIVIMFLGTLINVAPSLIYRYKQGKNKVVAVRSINESELYGLKITQMLLPVTGHRLDFFMKVKSKYNQAFVVSENDFSSLGIIGALGLIFLLARLFLVRSQKKETEKASSDNTLSALSLLNLSAILLATIGGFSSFFALVVSQQIRAYNRISIFIAFFALFAAVIIIDKFLLTQAKKRFFQPLSYFFLLTILLVGILDQTTGNFIPRYEFLKKEISSQSRFVKEIEKKVPNNAMILQLPYVPFPENPPVHLMTDYDHFAGGYLHSKNIRWSYGSMKGRSGDKWQKSISEKPVNELINNLSLSGFSGIYLDRFGYENTDLENELKTFLGTKPIESESKRLIFFDLKTYSNKLKKQLSKEDWKLKKDKALKPALLNRAD
ncbi:MAG: hypothetical protein E3J54_02930 [Actinobacteria bacterium]|nr:MAG: hypothetical protein E3J54_02930 [Actinomycetota bacterium]